MATCTMRLSNNVADPNAAKVTLINLGLTEEVAAKAVVDLVSELMPVIDFPIHENYAVRQDSRIEIIGMLAKVGINAVELG